MPKLSDVSKKIIITLLAISLVAFGIGAFIVNDIIAYAKGLAFGTLFTILKLILLERTLNKSINMPAANASNYARLHYMMRYFLTGVVLVVSALEPSINMFGVIIGLIILRPAVYIVNIKTEKVEKGL